MKVLGAIVEFLPQGIFDLLRVLGWRGFVIALCIFLLTILLVLTLGNSGLSRNRKIR
jgi:hypothetical protein